MTKKYQLKEKLWLYPGKAGWYFITLQPDLAREIDFFFGHQKKGWGSLRVKVNIGQTTWMTSIFTDKKSNSYLLPVKTEVRKRENLSTDNIVEFKLEILS